MIWHAPETRKEEAYTYRGTGIQYSSFRAYVQYVAFNHVYFQRQQFSFEMVRKPLGAENRRQMNFWRLGSAIARGYPIAMAPYS